MTALMNVEKMSSTFKELDGERKGYRNNEWGESRIWSLRDVVYHEMTALMNSDIPEFLNEQYGADICKADDGSFDQEAFEYEAPCYVDDVMQFIEEKTGEGELHGVWLTTTKGVCEIYHSGAETPITSYRIPTDALVISDLDEDGCLFVTKTHPDELILSFEVHSITPKKRRKSVA